jgi:hypothetical protein
MAFDDLGAQLEGLPGGLGQAPRQFGGGCATLVTPEARDQSSYVEPSNLS